MWSATPSIRDCAKEVAMTSSVGTGGAPNVELLDSRGTWRPVDGLLLEVDELEVEFRPSSVNLDQASR